MFYKLINLIKLNLILKNKITTAKLNKNDFQILKIFLKLNIIKAVTKKNKNNFYIHINTNNYYKNIINLYKLSKPVNVKLNNIKKINIKKNSIYYLSTNKGVLTSFEAETEKIGGILIMKIFI